jgi:hypothetical protein
MQHESENPLSGVTLGFFPENLGEDSHEHKRFGKVEKWYQGNWTLSMLADYFWTLKRDVPDAIYWRNSYACTF